MSSVEFIDEPVLVEARLLPDGHVGPPAAFRWRGRTYRVGDTGRQWQEEAGGIVWHCYLVRTPGGNTYELRLDLQGARWLLSRAWQAPHIA